MGNLRNDEAVLKAVTDMLQGRIPTMGREGLSKLKAQCSDEGRATLADHPQYEEGTTERWAWHAGYVVAMRDTLGMIEKNVTEWPMQDEG